MLRALTHSLNQLDDEGRFEVSFHSLKVTTLSWCAKFGLSGMTRSILGRHSGALVDTYTIYSRDLAVALSRELQSVINEIAAGKFVPDTPQRDFFPFFPPAPPALESDKESACDVEGGKDADPSRFRRLRLPSVPDESTLWYPVADGQEPVRHCKRHTAREASNIHPQHTRTNTLDLSSRERIHLRGGDDRDCAKPRPQ